ncbi:DUF554 domain-containing protein [Oscillospiraceae bacterium MB08-C2-2]|nr:DUF554 domain-containing protein [Oscillospiraceae bacterium MB08-C2-2]
MIGLGTAINAAGILIGGVAGLLVGKGLTKRFQDTLMSAMGICILFISIAGVLKEVFVITGDQISTQGTFMMIVSMVAGALTGELIDIERRTVQFGEWLKKKTNNKKDTQFVDGFVLGSLTVCVGAMAVIGAIKDGISGDYSILLTKAILDAVIILVMTASYGKGCIFSVIPVVLFQGSVTVLARLMLPIMTVQALSNLSLVGSILIFCVGINLTFGKKIKVANLLPSIVFAVLWALIPWLE